MTRRPPLAEVELLDRLRAGEMDAVAQAYDLYAKTVFRIGCRLLGESADAEDLVQDVFAGLTRTVRTFEGRGSFENWLKRVAVRAALMKLRQERVHHRSLRRHGWWMRRTHEPVSVAQRLDLEEALKQLDCSLRSAFILKEAEGYSHKEVAEILGISVGAARVRLYRARRKLRAYLGSD